MANWSNPLITTQYDVFVAEAKDRDVDVAQMFMNPATNIPVGSIKLQRTPTVFQEWSGSAWADKVLAVSGGGTGSSTQAGAVAGLGLGTMAAQNSNAVSISGGQITIGYFGLFASILLGADGTYDLGTNGTRFRTGYFRHGLVIPAGVDKYVVG